MQKITFLRGVGQFGGCTLVDAVVRNSFTSFITFHHSHICVKLNVMSFSTNDVR